MTAGAARVAALVLAGGESTRFGSTKQLAEHRGIPLVAHATRAALDAGLDHVIVVVGHDAKDVADELRVQQPDEPVQIVHNAEYTEGIASSLRAGLRSLDSDVACAVVLLADEPNVTPDAIRAVVAAWRRSDLPIARARYGDRPGHPVALDRSVWGRALALRGDAGVREIIRTRPELVHDVAIEGPAPVDIDRPEDFDRLRRGRD